MDTAQASGRMLPSAPVLAEVLDHLADPMAMVRPDGELVFANRAMTGLLAEGRLLTAANGRIGSSDRETARALKRLLVEAAAQTGEDGEAHPLSAALHTGRRPAHMRASVLRRGQDASPDRDTLLCLVVDDPERPMKAGVDQLAGQFGLTPREALVGAHLAAGFRIGEIASSIGVSRNTVRTHAALLREKLGERSALAVAARLRSASIAAV
jgi:DNA-binding NarL/FixJ family response regulator